MSPRNLSVLLVEDSRVLAERLRAGCAIIVVSHDPAQGGRLGATSRRIVERRFEAVGA